MKGLLLKDLLLLKNQKRILPLFLFVLIWMVMLGSASFAIPFLSMMAVILAQSSFSYDEIDHSNAFLFTLPFSGRTYVLEKYLFSLLCVLSVEVLAVILITVGSLFAPQFFSLQEGLEYMIAFLPICLLFTAFALPMRIRFSGDQSRFIYMALYGIIALLVIALQKLVPQEAAEKLLAALTSVPVSVYAVGIPLLIILLLLLSYRLSCRWLEAKEY